MPIKTVSIFCSKCQALLFKYKKGGKGALVKYFKERISKNYTQEPCCCPNFLNIFAREILVKGTPAYKIIGGKV